MNLFIFWMQCSSTCGFGQQEMKFECHIHLKSKKMKSAKAAYVSDAPLLEEEEEEEEEEDGGVEEEGEEGSTAYGHRKQERKERRKDIRKECGSKPELIRSCFSSECPQTKSQENSVECKDSSFHCSLPILQRYCALPKFLASCCLSCLKNP